jgi:peptide/nickel transport system substrate-binding protein
MTESRRPAEAASLPTLTRQRLLQRAVALGAAPTLLSVAAACGGGSVAAGGGSAGSTLRVLPNGAPTTFDPARWTVAVDQWALQCIYEGLVTFRPGTTEVANVLAKSFTPSSDGLRYDFELKPGIQFHAGYGEVTAEDVKFSYERIAGIADPKFESPESPDWAALQEVQVTGRYSGTIVLTRYFAPLLNSVLPVSSGYIVSKKAVLERGDKFQTQPVGTGPYQLSDYVPGQVATLTKFAGYSKAASEVAPEPEWKQIDIVLSATQTGDVALSAGDVQLATLPLDAVDRMSSGGSAVAKAPTCDYVWLNMNMLAEPLKDINVRRAIRSAIDVPAILQAAFNDKWRRATAAIAPNMPLGYWPDAPVYNRDVAQAKSYMRDAGVSSLSLTLTINSSDLGARDIAQIVQQNLKDIGIAVSVSEEDNSTYFTLGKVLRKRELTLVLYTAPPDPVWVTQWFTSSQFDQWNWMYWSNKRFDELHQKALLERDKQKRAQMYVEMQKIWDEAANVAWLAWPTNYFGHVPTIKPSFTTWGWPILWNVRSA